MARILTIDDDVDLLRFISRVLKSAGHEPSEARDGREGVRLAAASAPDLVITDITMPDQEGIQTIQELRETYPLLPIIVISGTEPVGNFNPLEDARLLGADAILAKPFNMPELLAEIDRLIARKIDVGP